GSSVADSTGPAQSAKHADKTRQFVPTALLSAKLTGPANGMGGIRCNAWSHYWQWLGFSCSLPAQVRRDPRVTRETKATRGKRALLVRSAPRVRSVRLVQPARLVPLAPRATREPPAPLSGWSRCKAAKPPQAATEMSI